MSETTNRRVQYLAGVCAAFSFTFTGATLAWPSPAIPKFKRGEINVDITDTQLSWVVALHSVGALLGCYFGQVLNEKLGRRRSFFVSAVPGLTGAVIMMNTIQPELMYVARFLMGLSTGIIAVVTMIYVTEIADKEIRGALGMTVQVMNNLGSLIIYSIGPFVPYSTLNAILLVIPIAYVLLCSWIPESPYYHLKDGRVEAAKKEFMKLKATNDERVWTDKKYLAKKAAAAGRRSATATGGGPSTAPSLSQWEMKIISIMGDGFGEPQTSARVPAFDVNVIEEQMRIMRAHVRESMENKTTLKELLTNMRYRKAIYIVTGLKLLQYMTGILVIQSYLEPIFRQSNFVGGSIASIVYGFLQLGAGIGATFLSRWFGRRILMFVSCLGVSIAMTVVGLYFLLQDTVQISPESLQAISYLPVVGILGFNILYATGIGNLPYVMQAELFPVNVKGIASSTATMLACILSFLVTKCYQEVKDTFGHYVVFWSFAIIGYAGLFFIYFYVPETKGKTLEEVLNNVQDKQLPEVEALNSENVESKEQNM